LTLAQGSKASAKNIFEMLGRDTKRYGFRFVPGLVHLLGVAAAPVVVLVLLLQVTKQRLARVIVPVSTDTNNVRYGFSRYKSRRL